MKKMNFKAWIKEARAKDKDGLLSGFSDKRLNCIISRWHLANEWDADKFLFYIKQGRSVRIADVIFFDGFAPILVLFISGICVVFTVPYDALIHIFRLIALGVLTIAFFAVLASSFWQSLVDVFQATPVYAKRESYTREYKEEKRETKQPIKETIKARTPEEYRQKVQDQKNVILPGDGYEMQIDY
jgi:hypothetical protein